MGIRHRFVLSGLTSAIALLSTQAVAMPYSSFDPRAFAMGGTGVASGTSANAGLMNPALLAIAREEDDFSVELPIVHGRLADKDDLIDAVGDLDDDDVFENLDAAIERFNNLNIGANLDAERQLVAAAINDMVEALNSVDAKLIQLEGAAGAVVGVPGDKLAVSVHAVAWGGGGAFAIFTDQDEQVLTDLRDDLALTDPRLSDFLDNPIDDDVLSSFVRGRLAVFGEVGVSLARQFNIGGQDIGIGVTPKVVNIATYDYIFVGNELDDADINIEDGEETFTDFNLDVGVAKQFMGGFTAGFAVKNLISRDYETALDEDVSIGPQARVGVAHRTDWTTVAFDLDLNAADAVGFESKTQYAGIGAELDVFDTMQLRFGYKHNLEDSDTSVPSIGLGFSPFGAHIDLAVAGNGDEIGFSGQLGFRF